MRVVTLVGARPQFIKASMLSRALSKMNIKEFLVHSGQHYDKSISQVFFDELRIPKPSINLGVGSASHSKQTGKIMVELEAFIQAIEPVDCLIAYGDTNTTLAGALVASKLGIPIIHVEAGLRSFNMLMPEEINRIITDKLSDLLFCPTLTAVDNLNKEGITKGVYLAGDVMYDATIHFAQVAKKMSFDLKKEAFDGRPFYLTTIHRPSNTQSLAKLLYILSALNELDYPTLFPAHPRTKEVLLGTNLPRKIKLIEPVGYLKMLSLIQNANAIITDSGGLQKEAYWLKKPCITLREETEWVETLEGGWNKLVGANAGLIKRAIEEMPGEKTPQVSFGIPKEGKFASDFIAKKLLEFFC